MFINHALLIGLIACAAFGAVIFGSLYYNPRLWLQDAPPAMKEAVPPLTHREKQMQVVLIIPLLASFLLPPLLGVLAWEAQQSSLSFPEAFAYLWLVWLLVNLFDAVVIDWLVLTVIQPRRFFIPGTQDLGIHMHDMRYHLKAFFKGIIITGIFSLIAAALIVAF